MFVIFDTVNIYYLPQYQPIINVLKSRSHQINCVCYRNKNNQSVFEQLLSGLEIKYIWVNDEQEAAELYAQLKPDWIFFGNSFKYLEQLNKHTKTAQLGHGIGPKPSYYHKSSTPMTVRFIEGKLRLNTIKKLYPNDHFELVGFSKLDPLFSNTEKGLDFNALNLDSAKQTILYAPTFAPSSLERFPDNWPEDFNNYNILIKPHTFTYTRSHYKKQRDKLKKWSQYSHVYVATELDISLLPFMKHADILLSEASSTLFEFVALNKPVIVCDFYQLKWSYRGIFKYRFNKRFGKDNVLYKDIGVHIDSYHQLSNAVSQQLKQPMEFEQNRTRYTAEHVGSTDGLTSERIVKYLENTT